MHIHESGAVPGHSAPPPYARLRVWVPLPFNYFQPIRTTATLLWATSSGLLMMWLTAGARCGCHDLSSSEQCNLLSGLTIRPTLLADDNGIPDIRPDIVGRQCRAVYCELKSKNCIELEREFRLLLNNSFMN